MIVEIDEVEPSLNVFPVFCELADGLGKELQRLDVTTGTAAIHEAAPLLDLPGRAFVRRIRIYPFENFAITFSGRQLFAQRREIEAEEILDVLIDGRVVGKLAVRPGDGGAALIEEPGQDDVATEAAAGASGRSFRQIRCGNLRCVRHDQSTIGS